MFLILHCVKEGLHLLKLRVTMLIAGLNLQPSQNNNNPEMINTAQVLINKIFERKL